MSPKEKEVTAPADICFHKLLHREDKEDMSFKLVNELPSPAEILEQFPLPEKLAVLKAERDEEIKKVITGESNKFLVIIGPCSADNEDAVCDYANRLAKVQEKTKDRLLIVPRVYTNKPRTTGEGYMGMLHQPDPEKKPDMLQGILAIRHMHRNTRNIWNGMVTDSVSGLIRLELTQVRLSMRYLPPAELNSNPTEAAWDY